MLTHCYHAYAYSLIKGGQLNGELLFPGIHFQAVQKNLQLFKPKDLMKPPLKRKYDLEEVERKVKKRLGGGDGSHSARFTFTAREEADLCDWINKRAQQPGTKPATRNEQRNVLRQALVDRQQKIQRGNKTLRPLNAAALRIIEGGSGMKLPSDDWFADLFKRYNDVIEEVHLEPKKSSIFAALQEDPIRHDFKDLADCLIARGILNEDQTWVEYPVSKYGKHGDIDGGGRTAGWISRAKTIQVDEKGQFIYYDLDKGNGRVKCLKVAVAKGHRGIYAYTEVREIFTYVPWSDVNGNVIFVQIIFKGKAAMVQHLVESLRDTHVLVQYSEKGMQTGETFAEALRYLDHYQRQYHKDLPAATQKLIFDGWRVVTTDGASRTFDYDVLSVAQELKIDLCIRLGASSLVTQMCKL